MCRRTAAIEFALRLEPPLSRFDKMPFPLKCSIHMAYRDLHLNIGLPGTSICKGCSNGFQNITLLECSLSKPGFKILSPWVHYQ